MDNTEKLSSKKMFVIVPGFRITPNYSVQAVPKKVDTHFGKSDELNFL